MTRLLSFTVLALLLVFASAQSPPCTDDGILVARNDDTECFRIDSSCGIILCNNVELCPTIVSIESRITAAQLSIDNFFATPTPLPGSPSVSPSPFPSPSPTNFNFTATPTPTFTPTATPFPTATPTPNPDGNLSISINTGGAASPYPSIFVSNDTTTNITRAVVTIYDFQHGFADDVGMLLVGPNDVTNVVLMFDVGGGRGVGPVVFVFDDFANRSLSDDDDNLSGTYKPTIGTVQKHGSAHGNFTAPAPRPPYGTTLSVFNGQSAAGDWKLYVDDDTAADGGFIRGWRIDFESIP